MNLESPTTNRVILTQIDVSAFQHPLDREATAQLKRVKGFDQTAAKFLEYGFERLDHIWNNASNVRVSARQFPKLHAMLEECCHILDLSPEPALYVASGPVNAYTAGHNNPYIVVFTGLLDLMDDDEVMAVIAHEVGHIKCGHVLYHMMARSIGVMIQIASDFTLGIGNLVGMPIQAALINWYRRAELTADRAALLALQDPRPCIAMLMKLAGGSARFVNEMSVEEFINQARTYSEEGGRSISERIYRVIADAFMKGSHPFAVERAKALNEWIDSPDYEQILTGIYKRAPSRVVDGRCPSCGTPVGLGHRFCGGCGHPIQV